MLTFDPQNQGRSDSRGEAPDQDEGFPAQSDGRPFFDGAQDALDFFLSTPARALPAAAELQLRHVARAPSRRAAPRRASTRPSTRCGELIDTARIGIAGHSFGAAGVSYVGQRDPRVKAVVAWDALGRPQPGGVRGSGIGGCVDPAERAPARDHQAGPEPDRGLLHPADAEHLPARLRGQGGGVEGVQRGGRRHGLDRDPRRHPLRVLLDPGPGVPCRAARRGPDHVVHDGVVRRLRQGRPSTGFPGVRRFRRLRTDRWRNDAPSAAVDPDGDANMMSRYYRSRLDIGRGGERFVCEDLRAGCPGLLADDGAARGLRLPLDRDHAGRRGPAGGSAGGARRAWRPRRCAARRPGRAGGACASRSRAHHGRGVPPDPARPDHAPAARRPLPAPLARAHVDGRATAPRPPRARRRRLSARFRGAAARSSTSRSRAAPAGASPAAARSARSPAAARSATPRSRGRCSAAAAASRSTSASG